MDYNQKQIPKGLICPLISTLNQDRSFSVKSFKRLLEHVLPHCDGIVVCDALWGEGLYLDVETKINILETALASIEKNFPVFICITSKTPELTVSFYKTVKPVCEKNKSSDHIFWIDYPLIYHSNRGLPQFYENLLSDSPYPLIIGNIPSQVFAQKGIAHHKSIKTSVLAKIANYSFLSGIFYSGSLKRSLEYHSILRSQKRFAFYDLNEAVFLKNPGQSGVVSGGSNFIPKTWRQITDTSLGKSTFGNLYGSRMQLLNTAQMAQDLYQVYQKDPVCIIKYLLYQVGIIDSPLMSTSRDLNKDSSVKSKIDTFLTTYDML